MTTPWKHPNGEDIPETWLVARAQANGGNPRDWSEEDREEWIQGMVVKADRQFGASLADLVRRCPEAAAGLRIWAGQQLL